MSTASAASPEARANYRALTPHTPYITQWSEEQDPLSPLIERPGRGIGYLDETLADRDDRGVLWYRTPSRPGNGEPLFAKVHPLRQRRAMRLLLCNVCAKPADRTEEGVLWLLRDFRDDWVGWPECMGAIEPPVCVPCVRLSSRMCPALRKGAVAVRIRHAPIAGVRGALYRVAVCGGAVGGWAGVDEGGAHQDCPQSYGRASRYDVVVGAGRCGGRSGRTGSGRLPGSACEHGERVAGVSLVRDAVCLDEGMGLDPATGPGVRATTGTGAAPRSTSAA